jgi:hypothetical protein
VFQRRVREAEDYVSQTIEVVEKWRIRRTVEEDVDGWVGGGVA